MTQDMENPPNSWIITVPETKLNEEEEAQKGPDWSNPGIDILESILRRLGPIENLKFAGVCRQWRSLRFASRHNAQHCPQFPLLMHPPLSFSHRRRFLSPVNSLRYKFSLSELFGETCLGSSGSWLVMRGRSLHLFNPFTLKNVKLPYIEEDPLEQAFSYKVPLVVLSSPNTAEFAAVMFYPQTFYYLRHGVCKWTSSGLHNGQGRIIQAAAVGGKFYALTSRGRLAHIDLERNPVLIWMDQAGTIAFDKADEHAYLVESNTKLVTIIAKCHRRDRSVPSLKALVLDPVTWTWTDAGNSLDGRVFFLGQRGSMSIATGGSRACVYTAGDDSFGSFEIDEEGGRGSLCCVHHSRSTAVWVMPELLFRDRKQRWWLGLYAVISERVILGSIMGLVVFEMVLLLSPRDFIRVLPPSVMLVVENVLVWGPVWISVCIACNCVCRTIGR